MRMENNIDPKILPIQENVPRVTRHSVIETFVERISGQT
jgi:hypothetical protein